MSEQRSVSASDAKGAGASPPTGASVGLRGWLERRIGAGELIDWFLEAPVAEGPSWARAAAVGLLVAMLMTGASGAALAITYAPAGAGAWASVYFTEFVLAGGWLLRSLHVAGAEASILFGVLALLLAVVEGRYKGRRDLAFWCMSLVVATTFVFCITGNPLRWDNRGYFGFQTEANVAAELPVLGGITRALLVGGAVPGNWTLTRLHAAHTLLLPLAVGALLALWLRSARRAAIAEAESPAPGAAGVARYGDAQLPRDLALGALAAISVSAVAYFLRAPLEAPADPLGSYNARPEWYFQSLYVLRNAVPPKMQGVVASLVPLVAAGGLFALPLLDRDPNATFKRRLPFILLFSLGLAGAAALTAVGIAHDARDPELATARRKQGKIDRRAVQIARAAGIPPAGALAMMRTDPVLHSEELFRDRCASCHKLGELGPADGKTTAPTLDGWGSEKWVLDLLDDPDARGRFGGGPYEGKMPSYTHPPKDPQAAKDFKPMPPEQLQAIARYLAGEARGAAAGHDPDGEKLVRQRCTSCHLLRGETDDAEGLAPELAGWASLGWTRAQIANPGTLATYRPIALSATLEGHMPRFDQDMTPADIDLLTRFVILRSRPAAK
jgi:ubiquinol-cytochrome c reductase cytochrome b subunit